jgi:predicted nucleotidyltransferase
LQCIADELKKRRALEGQNERYMKARKKTVSDEILEEIVRRIVKAVQPKKIILFGSAAREEMGPDSDLDFLVIKSCKNRRKTARKIRRRLIGIGIPKDIIVATPEDIERYKDTIGLIYRPALKEGKVLYAA